MPKDHTVVRMGSIEMGEPTTLNNPIGSKCYKNICLIIHPDKCRNALAEAQRRLMEIQQELNEAHERAEEAKEVFGVDVLTKKGPLTRAILHIIEGKGVEVQVCDDVIRNELLRALRSSRSASNILQNVILINLVY